MFERQIRLSRYDADKLFNSSTPGSSRMSSQHREISSPTRSRSISPNDLLYRQRRTIQSTSILPAPTISLPVPTYPDVVISHTPPAESTKPSNEQIHNENLLINNQGITKEKKLFLPNRNSISHENNPLCVIVDESSSNVSNHQRPNLLLPSISSSETVDCQPLDFKSRLALFNRTNTQQSNENSLNIKKPINPINVLPVKPVIHQSTRLINEEKKEILPETIQNQLSISISRSVVNTAKAVTFFGGDKLNGNTKSSLPKSIAPPPPPIQSQKNEQSSPSTSMDLLRTPNVIGGNVKLNKSSIFSGAKKVFPLFLFSFSIIIRSRMLEYNLLIMSIHLNILHLKLPWLNLVVPVPMMIIIIIIISKMRMIDQVLVVMMIIIIIKIISMEN
jgi:hypothetical protein